MKTMRSEVAAGSVGARRGAVAPVGVSVAPGIGRAAGVAVGVGKVVSGLGVDV